MKKYAILTGVIAMVASYLANVPSFLLTYQPKTPKALQK